MQSDASTIPAGASPAVAVGGAAPSGCCIRSIFDPAIPSGRCRYGRSRLPADGNIWIGGCHPRCLSTRLDLLAPTAEALVDFGHRDPCHPAHGFGPNTWRADPGSSWAEVGSRRPRLPRFRRRHAQSRRVGRTTALRPLPRSDHFQCPPQIQCVSAATRHMTLRVRSGARTADSPRHVLEGQPPRLVSFYATPRTINANDHTRPSDPRSRRKPTQFPRAAPEPASRCELRAHHAAGWGVPCCHLARPAPRPLMAA